MKTFFALSIITLISLFSCSEENDQGIFQEDLSGRYSYTVIISCFCGSDYRGPHSIILEDGIVTKFNGDDVESDQSNYDLIQSLGLDDLILQAETIIDNGPFQQSVEYHPTYGFIEKCYFDVNAQIADEEWGYTISEFEVL